MAEHFVERAEKSRPVGHKNQCASIGCEHAPDVLERTQIVVEALREGDELKVVVCGEADFRWAVGIVDRLGLWGRVPVLFSPSFGDVAPSDLARWVLTSERPARLQLQMHKIIWGAEARGV